MKKIILFSALALFLSAIVGCEKDEKPKNEKCIKLHYEKLIQKNFKIEGVIKYSKKHKQYVLFIEKQEGEEGTTQYEEWRGTTHFFCPQLTKEFQQVGLHLIVTGDLYMGVLEENLPPKSKSTDLPPTGVLLATYKLKNYIISKK